MPEQPTSRPTKKQYELLEFIGKFIAEKGYGPSYREIRDGCNYKSVATVALHVNNLIAKGHLYKKNKSARSLELKKNLNEDEQKIQTNFVKSSEEKWLVEHINYRFEQIENGNPSKSDLDGLYVLVGALKVLGLEGAAQSFSPRLSALKKRYN